MNLLWLLDANYWLFMGPTMLLALYAQIKVKSAYAHWSRVPVMSGMSGAQAAAELLRRAGIYDVRIEQVGGWLSDHYDPTSKTLRLSPGVYSGRSVAAVGIAAHEAGHALQHATAYVFLGLRSAIVPMASLGSGLSMTLVMIGVIFNTMAWLKVGIVLFSAVVIFQLVTLPVEFNASTRAKRALAEYGILSGPEEELGVRKVLGAAAMTYVAATLTAVAQLLYFIMLAGGGRRD